MSTFEELRDQRNTAALQCADLVNLKLWDEAAAKAAVVAELDVAILAHLREPGSRYTTEPAPTALRAVE